MDKRLNVCLLNDSFPPVIDGVANAVFNYARIISRRGGVSVAAPYYPGAKDEYPFSVLRYPSVKTPGTAGYRAGLPYPVRTVRDLAAQKPDVIHCHCPFVSAVLARSLRTATGAPIVFTYHTKFDIDIAESFDSSVIRTAARKLIVANIEACDEVWAVSQGAGENLKSLGYSGGYRVMENGTDFPRGKVPKCDSALLRREYGLDTRVPVFLFVGRMMWYKGLRTIIDGLFKAKANGVRFKMLFVGGGGDFCEIMSYAETLGLTNECVFTGPVPDRELLRAHFSLADMFLFPSDYDTNGIVVREAAACGLASVLLRGSAAAESVTDGQNGLLFGGEPEQLAEIIGRVAANRKFAEELGRCAMEELYLPWDEAVGAAYLRYHEVLERHNTTPATVLSKNRRRRSFYKSS